MPEIIIAGVFLLSFIIQLGYYAGIYLRFIIADDNIKPGYEHPLSVIICARNEADNLEVCLPIILSQDYPDFEVIVVNDCSTDNTDEVLGKMQSIYPGLKVTNIKRDRKFNHGKKLAVIIGMKSAKNDQLVFTDADCRPESDQWLRRMGRHFSGKTDIVLGYGGYLKQDGWLNKYIRYDTMFIALQYFSFALAGIPYMGVGRNMAYRKSLFFSGKGFSKHLHLASGDDDLFINEHANSENTAIEFSFESHTRSVPKDTIKKWMFQKTRHFSTSVLYKQRDKFLLLLEPLSRLLFYGTMVIMLIKNLLVIPVLAIFVIRLIIWLIVIKKTMIRLNENNLLVNSLLFDVISLFVNVFLYVLNRFRKGNFPWK